ncbi:hypothetical protein ES703_05162 [subsurface metagenome]
MGSPAQESRIAFYNSPDPPGIRILIAGNFRSELRDQPRMIKMELLGSLQIMFFRAHPQRVEMQNNILL